MEKVLANEDWIFEEGTLFSLLKKCRPRSWFHIVPRLLEQEDSAFMNSTHVIDYMHRCAQDLLTSMLKDDPSPLFELSGKHCLCLRSNVL